jgi:hypothetical protein
MNTIVISERPLEQLEAVICQSAANLTAAEHDWLLAVAEFDRREGWKLWECQSCAAWLSWQVGLDMRAAREKVRVARALEQFPSIAAAMATGTLSYSKVRAITRIATPECEQALVEMATAGTTNHAERIVSAYRRAEPITIEREQLQHARRSLHHHTDDDGSIVISVRLPAEAGTAVLSAIEHLVAPSLPDIDGARTPLNARRADALVELAVVAHASSSDGDSPSRYLVMLHVTESAMQGCDGCCEIDGHDESIDQPIGVSVATAQRLACDADLQTVFTDDDGNVTRLSRRQRLVRGTLRRKVEIRDDHRCQVPGCGRRANLDVHHLRHRAHGGSSKLPNLTLLCRFHHHRLHEGGWTSVRTPDGLEFHDGHGRRICPRTPVPSGNPSAVADHHRKPDDGRCKWGGERLDLDLALTALFSRTHPHSPGGSAA